MAPGPPETTGGVDGPRRDGSSSDRLEGGPFPPLPALRDGPLAPPDEPDGVAAAPRPGEAERLAARLDRDAAALFLHAAALQAEEAARDRHLAALAVHQAALERASFEADELTGVLRRRTGLPALQREIDRCRRAGDDFVLGFLDVDGLKQVNDTLGHLAGDDMLWTVAVLLRASLRSYDIVVRFGGDEFVYSVAGATLDAAEARFDELARSLAGAAPGRTVTAGFAQLRSDDTLESLLARADADLYGRRRRSRQPGGPASHGNGRRHADRRGHAVSG